MRLELPDGQYADLRDRLTYDQAREVRRAFLAKEIDPMSMADFDLTLVRSYVSGWNVLDREGHAVAIDGSLGEVPDDLIQKIAQTALDDWNGKAVPKEKPRRKRGVASSPSTLRALG